MTLGNHEFEYGWEILVDTIPRATFPVLNANIYNETTGNLIAKPYTILEKRVLKLVLLVLWASMLSITLWPRFIAQVYQLRIQQKQRNIGLTKFAMMSI